ncbi:hypothetical protein ACIJYD_03120 [Candidatus Pelagibacter bacterium nBUS_33]|uniref:hypothetical protein n=1 Tax=Candidatus Pelagibacter bacterium nBUS_33 TaxID=3374193 RepID=UPI003EBCAC3A
MSDEKIQYDVHDYTPVNRYIDDQARLKRSASTWRYAKAAALILVAAGILAVLLACAYYLYKKPHRLVSLSEIEKKVITNEDRIINAERKLPKDDEINTSTTTNILQDRINEKDLEIAKLKEELENSNNDDLELKQKLEEEKIKVEQEKLDLQKKLMEKKQVRTNVIHFQYVEGELNGSKISVTTRLHYDDPSNLSPNKKDGSDPINCYVTFPGRDDLSVVELGDRSEEPIISKYHLETLNVSFNDFINLKNNKCQFN